MWGADARHLRVAIFAVRCSTCRRPSDLANAPNSTLVNERFLAVHITIDKMRPIAVERASSDESCLQDKAHRHGARPATNSQRDHRGQSAPRWAARATTPNASARRCPGTARCGSVIISIAATRPPRAAARSDESAAIHIGSVGSLPAASRRARCPCRGVAEDYLHCTRAHRRASARRARPEKIFAVPDSPAASPRRRAKARSAATAVIGNPRSG